MASSDLQKFGAKLIIIAAFVLLLIQKTKLQDINKIAASCKVHNDVIVDIDPGKHRYFPYIVKLPRCAGNVATSSPNVKICAPTAYRRLPYTVMIMPFFRPVSVSLDHHTSCDGKCVKSSSSCNRFENWNGQKCQCDCMHTNAIPPPCTHPLVWKQSKCNCACPSEGDKCSSEKEWSSGSCTCMCKKRYLNRCLRKKKLVNEETCKCMDLPAPNVTTGARGSGVEQDCVKSTTIIIIAFIEFLFLMVVFVLIYRFCLKRDLNSSASRGSKSTKWPWHGMNCQGYNGSHKGQQKEDQQSHQEQLNGNVSSGNSYEEQSLYPVHQEKKSYSNQTDVDENVELGEGYEDPIRFSCDQINNSMDSKVTEV